MCMGLDSLSCNLVDKIIFQLCLMHIFPVWLVFCSILGIHLVSLDLYHWGGLYVLFCVCCGLVIYIAV